METYYLNTIIFFFKTQREMGYRAIEQVLRIIDHDAIPDKRRRKMLIRVLRNAGLNDIPYKEGKFEPEFIPIRKTSKIITSQYPTQTVHLHLYNGILELPVSLN